jgi:hypothetical protein
VATTTIVDAGIAIDGINTASQDIALLLNLHNLHRGIYILLFHIFIF